MRPHSLFVQFENFLGNFDATEKKGEHRRLINLAFMHKTVQFTGIPFVFKKIEKSDPIE